MALLAWRMWPKWTLAVAHYRPFICIHYRCMSASGHLLHLLLLLCLMAFNRLHQTVATCCKSLPALPLWQQFGLIPSWESLIDELPWPEAASLSWPAMFLFLLDPYGWLFGSVRFVGSRRLAHGKRRLSAASWLVPSGSSLSCRITFFSLFTFWLMSLCCATAGLATSYHGG